MKHQQQQQPQPESLYLEVRTDREEPALPLHSSIALFLLSYCQSSPFDVLLLSAQSGQRWPWRGSLPETLAGPAARPAEAPGLVRACRMPAVADADGRCCRAGLAVVLRHVVQRTCDKKAACVGLASLLGFKKTCLKACAEVSKWTRLCELEIPSAVEQHLLDPKDEALQIPPAVLLLEKRLREPVRVHNDDKLRRQKLQQQKGRPAPAAQPSGESCGLELTAAMARLSADESLTVSTRGSSDIRKVKTDELPELEHVFAEGLYFTLTDVVLLPCVHQYLVSVQKHSPDVLSHLPLLLRWYCRVQEVPGVITAAKDCGMSLFSPQAPKPSCTLPGPVEPGEVEKGRVGPNPETFVGGPRPTLTKLKESGIEASFSPHPCPAWNVPWDSLPVAVNPIEGRMSDVRATRKRQQLNNLVAMVTAMARPGQTVVDFCSGGGHVGIVLAHMLPECQVILIENKEESLVRAKERSAKIGLNNISFIQANLDYYTGPFHFGVALHACGVATDMVVDRCIQARAAFVVSPCCYGFIQNTLKFNFPRSQKFFETLSFKEHMILCRFADQTAVQLPPERRLIGKSCMGLVDLDRCWAAEALGYSVNVITMEPESCSPKNNMLVGKPLTQKS
ncbi:glutathione S-transferase C-terminal domain-containing protein isoform X1 [Denticeps clupeoides]|uniref:Glutathione S-transferase C-terminal domain-containing protein n=1 Tax=Denticeps clupeoides TaxID=299321 RepID=A0AAY4B1N4_9TELE|nr:glutathione S-transferase C-terminal domain-containing protein isoform X1 [Denticeps clupeoides]